MCLLRCGRITGSWWGSGLVGGRREHTPRAKARFSGGRREGQACRLGVPRGKNDLHLEVE